MALSGREMRPCWPRKMAICIWMKNISILQDQKMQKKQVLLEICAHTISSLTEGGQAIITHQRALMEITLQILVWLPYDAGYPDEKLGNKGKQCASQRNARCFKGLHEHVAKRETKGLPAFINVLTNQYGFQAAVNAKKMACLRGSINICDDSVLAARITGYGIYTPLVADSSLAVY